MPHKHPWDPKFALPSSILAEPPGNRGSHITAQIPRKTYDALVPYNDMYALPDYLENPGTEARYTRALQRKWIPSITSISMPGLGNDQAPVNPFAEFGPKAADALLAELGNVPPVGRLFALRLAMDAIEPGLYSRFLAKLELQQKNGRAGMDAVRAAIAEAAGEGFVREIVALGQGKRPPPRSLAGLGYYGPQSAQMALDGFFGKIWGGIKGVATSKPIRWIAAGASVVMPVAALGVGAPVLGRKELGTIAKTGAKYAGKAIGAVAGVACKVLSSPIAPLAGGAAAAAFGAPPQVGMVGAQVGQSLCPAGTEPVVEAPPPPLPPPSIPWVPIAIGGGALLLILLATSSKKRSAPTEKAA